MNLRIARGWPVWVSLLFASLAVAAGAREPITRTWEVGGVKREALLWLPAQTPEGGAPVVFLFHGHGGTAAQIARSLPVPQLWPEALVVSMQGLPTRGQLTDPAGQKAGWQARPGTEGDRDLAFFDAVWATLQRDYRVDGRRVYATGHSNGGGFTYLLWATRRSVFAAFAPSSAVAPRDALPREPAPVLHLAGSADPLVKFAWQERLIGWLRRLDRCEGEGVREGALVTRYASVTGNPVVTYIHPGGHALPADAAATIVAFLRAQARP